MARPRKRPARPAPAETPDQPVNEVTVEPAQAEPPAPNEPTAPIAQIVEPVIPRNADDVVHNVMLRQLTADAANPPPPPEVPPALQVMRQIQEYKDNGQPLAPLESTLARLTSGADVSNRASWMLYRKYRNDKLTRYLESDARMDVTLFRMFARGDLNPTEVLVLKKLCQTEISDMAKELLQEVQEGTPDLNPAEATSKMDMSFEVSERAGAKALEGTTPQGREIVRKLVFHARRKLYSKKK